ncbi:hypothetical protein [Sedimentitalea sp.]|uniref:hypothetical protein n=1 Tax=Sedimentitalea sp. TaxID=2048915 RepID=UPI003299A30F
MIEFYRSFRKDEAGDTTVDWIVLSAAVVALSGTTYTAIESGVSTLTASTLAHVIEQPPVAK